ncbi:MAG: PAS domain S-box protein [Spirochaetaceae bacterium]|nr:MAG: PAS domain S-box protein [Spirochaetaceae bacterium]
MAGKRNKDESFPKRKIESTAVQELQQLLQASLEATGDGILVVDNDGQIILSNERFADMWRIPRSMIRDKDDIKIREFVMDQLTDPQDYLEKTRVLYDQSEESTDILTFKDGRIFERYSASLQISGAIVGRVWSFRDITAYTVAQQRLERSEQKYRDLVENAGSIILRWDTRGVITYINEYGQRLLGYTEGELVGQSVIGTIVPGRDSSGRDLVAMIQGITSNPNEYTYNENENITKEGQSIWVSWSNRPIHNERGQLVGVLSIGTDISERKKLEQQLFQAQKMEAVGQLAGGIAHDFNNMLMVINGYCELLLEDMHETDELRRDIEQIKATASRAAALTRQLLAFGRRQVVQPKVVDINKLLYNSQEMIGRLVGESVMLKVLPRNNSLYIYADPVQIEQVILNIAANARDAMTTGGELIFETNTIDISNQEAGERYMVPAGSYVVCTVRDTGIGMSSETLEHIFEPFFTTKDPGKGTGLGLSTVYGIVKQNDGYIFADSEPGKGSCFTMYFPLVSEEEIVRSEMPHTPEEQLRGSERILLVEREAKVRRYTKTVLQKYGYGVEAAASASDALGLGKTLEVDLLITLCELEETSGVELAEKIREMQPDVKVLMISEAFGCESAADYDTISKPFTSEALLRKIRKILK